MKKILLFLVVCFTSVGLFALGGADNNVGSGSNNDTVNMKEVSTADVEKALNDKNSVVVDTRTNGAFIGWAINGNKRGGHILGAKDFSARWLTVEYDDKKNLENLTRDQVLTEALKNKNISKEKNIILYDTNGKDAGLVAKYLAFKGFKKLSYYNANAWIKSSRPLNVQPDYKRLLPPTIVEQIITGKKVKGFDNKDVVIVDVRWGDNESSGYSKAHIPHSVHVNSDSFEPPKEYIAGCQEWRLADDNTLAKLLLANGITSKTTVIATSPEPMAASRFAVICEYLGVNDVRVLNGGLVSWKAEGFEFEKGVNNPVPANNFGTSYPQKPELIDTIEEAVKILKDKNRQLIDNRTWEEHIGESSGYSYHNKKGRISGAIYSRTSLNSSYSLYYYRNIDKTMRNPDEIINMWKEDGIDINKDIAFMCGSGWRVAEVLWYSKVMGMANTSIYSDGWIRWSNEERPTITGNPKK